MKSGRWDNVEQAQNHLAHLKQDIAQGHYAHHERATSNRDMRDFVRDVYFSAIKEARYHKGFYDPQHTVWETTFYQTVGTLMKYDYKPERIKEWLSEESMLADRYPINNGIAHIINEPIGNREKMASKIYDLRHSYTEKNYVGLTTIESPLPCIDPYIDLLKLAQRTMLEICPDQQRIKRIDNHLDNLQRKYNTDRSCKQKYRNIYKLT